MESVNTSTRVRVSDAKRKRAGPCVSREARAKFSRVCSCDRGCCCCSRRSVVKNYTNLFKSGLPRRLMFFSDGEWCDFPETATPSLIEAFTCKSLAQISMHNYSYIVDFSHMLLINMKTGVQKSVAWIDESNKCFFPESFSDEDCVPTNTEKFELKLEIDIDISGVDSLKPEECTESSEGSASHLKDEAEQNSETKEVIAENGVPSVNDFSSEPLCENLVRLEGGSGDYVAVENVFISGLGTFVSPNNVVGIYRYFPRSRAELERLQLFEEQIEITKKCRGDANVLQGWYGSSREAIVGILLHGIWRSGEPLNGVAYGTGIYLAPEKCSHLSVNYSDIDENGVQHAVLCRIIMGKMEQVKPGSDQFRPTCEDFDSGVDDIANPMHYVIWNAHMNTHIHPEFVVSFKLPLSVREYLAGLKCNQSKSDVTADNQQTTSTVHLVKDGQHPTHMSKAVKMPTSAWLPFSVLFTAIQKSMSPAAKDLLDCHYSDFKSKKITREELIKQLRLLAGDDLLISTLKTLQFNPPLVNQTASRKVMPKDSPK
eukprot:TRINITY_DN583_c0_g1_i2.p1 TRINITY_DN583_c0_g1~~TRINITY_DN583_c0_g1_i2.p1  ORF type:complete len:542 (+),score=71.28 TRINITY_DN583_c0_g1_i2:125-1750(+)